LVRSFTAHVPLLMATSAFGLGRRLLNSVIYTVCIPCAGSNHLFVYRIHWLIHLSIEWPIRCSRHHQQCLIHIDHRHLRIQVLEDQLLLSPIRDHLAPFHYRLRYCDRCLSNWMYSVYCVVNSIYAIAALGWPSVEVTLYRRHLFYRWHTCSVTVKLIEMLEACFNKMRMIRWQCVDFKSTQKTLPSVLWRCWLGGRKDIRPVKNWVVGCWCGYLSGARCRLAYGPDDATATHCLLSCFSKIKAGFTFLVPAYPGSPRKRAVKHVCKT